MTKRSAAAAPAATPAAAPATRTDATNVLHGVNVLHGDIGAKIGAFAGPGFRALSILCQIQFDDLDSSVFDATSPTSPWANRVEFTRLECVSRKAEKELDEAQQHLHSVQSEKPYAESPLPSEDDTRKMSVKDLRALIKRCGGNSEGCLEKSEILARALIWLGRENVRLVPVQEVYQEVYVRDRYIEKFEAANNRFHKARFALHLHNSDMRMFGMKIIKMRPRDEELKQRIKQSLKRSHELLMATRLV